MKILYLAPSPKAGQIEHLQPLRAQGLIDAGFAQEVPYKNYLEFLKETEAVRQKTFPEADNRPKWGVRFLEQSRKYVVVVNSLVGETIYGENVQLDRSGRPDFKGAEKQLVTTLKAAGCPQAVIEKYLVAKSAPDFLAREAARIEEDKRNAAAQREREKAVPRFI